MWRMAKDWLAAALVVAFLWAMAVLFLLLAPEDSAPTHAPPNLGLTVAPEN